LRKITVQPKWNARFDKKAITQQKSAFSRPVLTTRRRNAKIESFARKTANKNSKRYSEYGALAQLVRAMES
jgi:hypothetical protein